MKKFVILMEETEFLKGSIEEVSEVFEVMSRESVTVFKVWYFPTDKKL